MSESADKVLEGHCATVYVSKEMRDEFVGWLEFAGPDYVPGVPHCPSWPREFSVREIGKRVRPDLSGSETWMYEVWSPEFEADLDGWCPIFHKHDDIGPTLANFTWCSVESCLGEAR